MDTRVIQVKSTDPKSQGDYVRIDASSFDENKHELFEGNPPDANTIAFAAERNIKLTHGKDISPEDRKEADRIYKQQQKDAKDAREKSDKDAEAEKTRAALEAANTRPADDPGATGKGHNPVPASEVVTPPTPGGAIPENKVLNPNTGQPTTPAAAAAAWDTGKGRGKS